MLSQSEVNGGAAVRFGIDPDFSIVAVDNSERCRETDTAAIELVSMKAPEGKEQFVGSIDVETDAVIGYVKYAAAPLNFAGGEFDTRAFGC